MKTKTLWVTISFDKSHLFRVYYCHSHIFQIQLTSIAVDILGSDRSCIKKAWIPGELIYVRLMSSHWSRIFKFLGFTDIVLFLSFRSLKTRNPRRVLCALVSHVISVLLVVVVGWCCHLLSGRLNDWTPNSPPGWWTRQVRATRPALVVGAPLVMSSLAVQVNTSKHGNKSGKFGWFRSASGQGEKCKCYVQNLRTFSTYSA